MKKRVFIILAALLLFFLMSLSIQAYERPPGWDNLKIDDSYEDHPWGDIDSNNPRGNSTDDLPSVSGISKETDFSPLVPTTIDRQSKDADIFSRIVISILNLLF
jgi:hypothetical protein